MIGNNWRKALNDAIMETIYRCVMLDCWPDADASSRVGLNDGNYVEFQKKIRSGEITLAEFQEAYDNGYNINDLVR